jgi:hypothetical protein
MCKKYLFAFFFFFENVKYHKSDVCILTKWKKNIKNNKLAKGGKKEG